MKKKIRILDPESKKLFDVTIDSSVIKSATRFPVSCFVELNGKPYIVYIDAQFKVRGVEPIHHMINNTGAKISVLSDLRTQFPRTKFYAVNDDKIERKSIVLDDGEEIFVLE